MTLHIHKGTRVLQVPDAEPHYGPIVHQMTTIKVQLQVRLSHAFQSFNAR